MGEEKRIETQGGATVEGNVSAGGNFTGRDNPEVVVTNNLAQVYGYTLADLRMDINYQKQQIERLREDLNMDRQTNSSVKNRLEEMQYNLDFLDAQVRNMLLLKPVPAQTPVVTDKALNSLMVGVGILILLTVAILIFIAWGR